MGYIRLDNGETFSDPSYTLRCFAPEIQQTTITELDLAYHGTAYGISNLLGSVGYVYYPGREGWIGAPGVTQTFLSGAPSPPLEGGQTGYNQDFLDKYTQIGLGKLESVGSPVTEDVDGYHNYGLYMQVTVDDINLEDPTQPAYFLQSSSEDDITKGFMAGDEEVYIQMPIWNWPGTAVVSGTVVFSSSSYYAPEETVAIPFNFSDFLGEGLGSVGDLSTAGDKIWRINRETLTSSYTTLGGSVDVENIKRVSVVLNPPLSGTAYDFKLGQMKVVGPTYNYYNTNVDTKRGVLKMERWPVPQTNLPALVQDGITIKDFTYVSKFTIGTALPGTAPVVPAGSGLGSFDDVDIVIPPSNELSLFARVHPDRQAYTNEYLQVRLTINAQETTLELFEKNNLTSSFIKDGPIPAGEYFLIYKVKDNTHSAQLYSGKEHFIEELYLESSTQIISSPWLSGLGDSLPPPPDAGYEAGYGYAGYEFRPQLGNFVLDYVYSKDTVLCEYESKSFLSNLPIESATLFPVSKSDSELLTEGLASFIKVNTADNFMRGINEVGNLDSDVTVEDDTYIIFEEGTTSKKVSKKKGVYIASLQYENIITVPNFSKLTFRAKLRFDNPMQQGTFKLIFWDKLRRRIAFIQEIKEIVPNKWNELEIPLVSDVVYNDELIFEIAHIGDVEEAGNFWLYSPSLTTESVEWELSNNGGKTYIPVLNAVSDQYKSVNFPSDEFYSIILKNNPTLLQTFDQIEDINYSIAGNLPATITNRFPYGMNSGSVVNTAGSGTTFVYPIQMPQTIQTTSGTSYYVPNCIETEKKDYFIALYDGSEIRIPSISGFNDENITYSIWFYADDLGSDIELGRHGSGPDWIFSAISPTNSISGNFALKFESTNGSKEIELIDPENPSWNGWADGKWHQASFVYNGKYVKIFFDGKFIGSESIFVIGALPSTPAGPFYIAGPIGSAPSEPTLGTATILDTSVPFVWIDTFVMYNQVVSESYIKQQYNAAVSDYRELRVRARSYTKSGWVVGYEVVPRYARLGRILETPSRVIIDSDTFDSDEDQYNRTIVKLDSSTLTSNRSITSNTNSTDSGSLTNSGTKTTIP